MYFQNALNLLLSSTYEHLKVLVIVYISAFIWIGFRCYLQSTFHNVFLILLLYFDKY